MLSRGWWLNSVDSTLVCAKGHNKSKNPSESLGTRGSALASLGCSTQMCFFCPGWLKAFPHSLPECEAPVFSTACTDLCLNYTEFNSFIYNLFFFFFALDLTHICELGSCVKSDHARSTFIECL